MTDHTFDHLKSTYFQECTELLDSVYVNMSALEEGREDDDTVHAIFRAIHSIKGGGGAFGFNRVVAFAHVLETLLDLLRDGKIELTPEIASLLIRGTDVLSDLVVAERTNEPMASGVEADLLAELEKAASLQRPGDMPEHSRRGKEASNSVVRSSTYRIQFFPHSTLFRTANEPLLLIRELKRMGQVTVAPDLRRLPSLEHMEPEDAYLGWTIDIATDVAVSRLEETFEFVSGHCNLSIDAVAATDCAPSDEAPQQAAVEIDAARTHLAAPDEPANKSATMLKAPKSDTAGTRRADVAAPTQTVRVDVEKVDRLVNLVGEMVINQAMLVQLGTQLPPEMCPGLVSGLDTLSQHLRELQEGVMAIRTQPVGSVFSRMPRLVRELSTQLGKEVRLVITGEATEIDKTVIEQLADPLTHLLRNSLDHGIERPDERIARGKPTYGTIHLAAEHRSGRIVIEVSDDGQGIDRTRVLARARQRGLIAADAVLSDEEIEGLIFLPGFSTVDVVSSISGRGVGMDVVRRNMQALGGRIMVQSRAGVGSRLLLSLPLTLAILDGMIVAVGRESYIVPLTNIIESLRPKSDEIHAVVGCGTVVAIRGKYVLLIHLARRFGVPDAVDDPARGIVVVVENESAGQIGLVVDELVGQQQVVVKSLEANYGPVDGVGGATILGDGRVALILDIARLHEVPMASLATQRGYVQAVTAAGEPGATSTLP